jgi:RimJ/RimL family protein N-acetyltransferase
MDEGTGLPHLFVDRAGRKLTIREVEEGDTQAVLAHTRLVDSETVFLSREPHESPRFEGPERQRITQVRGRPGSLFIVAFDDLAIVGSLDFHGGTRKRTAHAGEFGLTVCRTHWGTGLGGHLVDHLLAWALRGGVIRKVRLRVHAGNAAAIGLYRSRGFVTEGRLSREMRINGVWVDVLVMGLWLESADSPLPC